MSGKSSMGKTTINELVSLVGRLQSERKAHVEAIAKIDDAFSGLGMGAGEAVSRGLVKRGPGRPRGSGKKVRAASKSSVGRPARKRSKFSMTANDLIVGYVKKAGAKGVSSGEIKRRWAAAGRPGEPYNTLGELVRSKKIVKKNVKGQRGSRYSAG